MFVFLCVCTHPPLPSLRFCCFLHPPPHEFFFLFWNTSCFCVSCQTARKVQCFQAVYVILDALNSPAVSRLQWSFDTLHVDHRKILMSVQSFLDPTSDYKNYKGTLIAKLPPAVPILYVVLCACMYAREYVCTHVCVSMCMHMYTPPGGRMIVTLRPALYWMLHRLSFSLPRAHRMILSTLCFWLCLCCLSLLLCMTLCLDVCRCLL
jgi:RasGEF domain